MARDPLLQPYYNEDYFGEAYEKRPPASDARGSGSYGSTDSSDAGDVRTRLRSEYDAGLPAPGAGINDDVHAEKKGWLWRWLCGCFGRKDEEEMGHFPPPMSAGMSRTSSPAYSSGGASDDAGSTASDTSGDSELSPRASEIAARLHVIAAELTGDPFHPNATGLMQESERLCRDYQNITGQAYTAGGRSRATTGPMDITGVHNYGDEVTVGGATAMPPHSPRRQRRWSTRVDPSDLPSLAGSSPLSDSLASSVVGGIGFLSASLQSDGSRRGGSSVAGTPRLGGEVAGDSTVPGSGRSRQLSSSLDSCKVVAARRNSGDILPHDVEDNGDGYVSEGGTFHPTGRR